MRPQERRQRPEQQLRWQVQVLAVSAGALQTALFAQRQRYLIRYNFLTRTINDLVAGPRRHKRIAFCERLLRNKTSRRNF